MIALGIAFAVLLIGQVTPDEYGRLILHGVPLNSLLFLGALPFLCQALRPLRFFAIAILPTLVALALSMIISPANSYGFYKAGNLILASSVVCALFARYVQMHSIQDLFHWLMLFLSAIFIFALVYKARYGFFDDHIRFGLNGSIVFGRLMGLGLLCTLMVRDKRAHWHYPLVAAFSFGVVWSGSRMVLVATGLAVILTFVIKAVERRMVLAALLFCVLFMSTLTPIMHHRSMVTVVKHFTGSETQEYSENRTLIHKDVFQEFDQKYPDCMAHPPCVTAAGDGTARHYINTLDTRLTAWRLSLKFMTDFVVLFKGVGLGHWSDFFRFYHYDYPHNIFLEASFEMGLTLALLFLIPFFYFVLELKSPFAIVSLYFMLNQQVSGDILDARFALIFSILSLMVVRKFWSSSLVRAVVR